MRLSLITLAVAAFSSVAQAWSNEDYEIFKINDGVTALEGENATFYSFVGFSRKAKNDELS